MASLGVAYRLVLAAGLILALAVPLLAQDGDQAPGADPAMEAVPGSEQGAEAPPPPNLECHGGAVEGSGTGFLSSQEASEDAAIAAWLEKAKQQDPLTKWETAGKAGLSCVKQGLFSKCFAIGVPCHLR
jgi:hypothetical protein